MLAHLVAEFGHCYNFLFIEMFYFVPKVTRGYYDRNVVRGSSQIDQIQFCYNLVVTYFCICFPRVKYCVLYYLFYSS